MSFVCLARTGGTVVDHSTTIKGSHPDPGTATAKKPFNLVIIIIAKAFTFFQNV
jgi:hypothetical protein